MSVVLSARLTALKKLAATGGVAADIGCDHGYLSIALIESGAYQKVIACDLREGPLNAAGEHVHMAGLEGRIECRRADGLHALEPGEAETLIIAGMGGALMMRILDEGSAVARSADLLVLQPQSELMEFRCWLRKHGYNVVSEDMVCEDAKYYPMMAAVPTTGAGEPEAETKKQPGEELADAYGGWLLRNRHPVLKEYLEIAGKQNAQLLEHLTGQREGMTDHEAWEKAARIDTRILELKAEEKRIMEALWFYRN